MMHKSIATVAVLMTALTVPGAAQEEKIVQGSVAAEARPEIRRTPVRGEIFQLLAGPQAAIANEELELAPARLKRYRRTTLDAAALDRQLALARDPEKLLSLKLKLFEDFQPEIRVERVERSAFGSQILTGTVAEAEVSEVVMVARDGRIRANLNVDGHLYQIRPAAGGMHHVYETDPASLPPESEPDPRVPTRRQAPPDRDPDQPLASPAGPAARAASALARREEAGDAGDASGEGGDAGDASATAGRFISTMVVYTPAAKTALGGKADTEVEIELAVAETNQGYASSGVSQRMVLVYMGEVSYTDSGSAVTDRTRLKNPSDGHMDGVHALRDEYDADIVTLLSTSSDWCGYAYIMSKVEHAFEDSAFSQVYWDCATGYYSFGHEIGHNMGARHDRRVDDTDDKPYDFNHGYVRVDKLWRTIMAYNTKCKDDGKSCTRILYWSNPNKTKDGVAMGIADGSADAADNRKTLNSTAATVSRFRTLGANENGDRFGAAVAAGDFNGDGKQDLAIGAPRESPGSDPQSGWVFTFKGTQWGLAPWKGFGQKGLGANENGDRFGAALAAGDFNNDGMDDLAVGAPGEAPGDDPKSGYVFIFKGTVNGLAPWKGFGQKGLGANEAGDRFGASLAAGDFDNDGRDDLAVGAPGEAPGGDPKSGYVFIFKGGAGGPTAWTGLSQAGLGANENDDRFGWSLAAGDFNNDGRDDLAVGAPGEAPGDDPKSGYVFIFKGGPGGPTAWTGLSQAGLGANENDDRFGWSLAAGDFDNDGRDDLAVGAPGEAPGNAPKSGYVFIFKGGAGGPAAWTGLSQAGLGANENGDLFGYALAAGDFSGDGRADLAVGAPGEAPGADPASGWLFFFKGSASGLTAWAGRGQSPMGANEDGDRLGWALAAGDFNNDGEADLAAGAPFESPGSAPQSGWVFTYRGRPTSPVGWRGLGQDQ